MPASGHKASWACSRSCVAPLGLEFERRLEEIKVEARDGVQFGQRVGCRHAAEPAISHKAPDEGAVLLLDPGLIVFLVGARARKFETTSAAIIEDRHECSVVIGADTPHREGQIGGRLGKALHNQRLTTHG